MFYRKTCYESNLLYNNESKCPTSRSPLPVAISTLIAAAKPTMADRPSHTSKLLPSLVLCSHRTESDAALLGVAFI